MPLYSFGDDEYKPPDYVTDTPYDPGTGGTVKYADTQPPAFSGGGGPPKPQDPYYGAYQQEHGLTDGAPSVGPQLNYNNTPFSGTSTTTANANDALRQHILDTFAQYGRTDTGPGSGPTDLDYYYKRILQEGGWDAGYDWAGRIGRGIMGTQPPETGGGGPAYGGTNVFSDPATQQWEQLVNAMVGRLNQPYTPLSFQPALDYLTSYFQQLQGPAYTPAQMDLLQTQALDPLERQHQDARRQTMERLAARGISPTSGITEGALQDVDRQFQTLDARTRGAFASNAVDLGRQNAAQAAQLGPLIASLEQQNFLGNENRQMQGLNTAAQVPQLAWNRLTGANQTIQPLSPSQLLYPLQSFQQQGYNQSSDFMSQLMQALLQFFR